MPESPNLQEQEDAGCVIGRGSKHCIHSTRGRLADRLGGLFKSHVLSGNVDLGYPRPSITSVQECFCLPVELFAKVFEMAQTNRILPAETRHSTALAKSIYPGRLCAAKRGRNFRGNI